MRHPAPPVLAVIGLLGLAMTGCGTYHSMYEFAPSPVRVQVPAEADAAESVQVLASVVGVRYRNRPKGAPPSVDVRMKLMNRTNKTVTLAAEDMELVSAGLDRLGEPALEPSGPVKVGPGEDATVLAKFPLPEPETSQLNGLNLQWTFQLDGETYTRNVSFARQPDRYDRGYGPRINSGLGVGVGWRID
jgi:hypothetical protein